MYRTIAGRDDFRFILLPPVLGELDELKIAHKNPDVREGAKRAIFVPHSAMASWVKGAEKAVMIDGCFLQCHGRALKGLFGEEEVVEIDALPFHRKYGDLFSMDDVPEQELKAVARQVADKIIATLGRNDSLAHRERTVPAVSFHVPASSTETNGTEP